MNIPPKYEDVVAQLETERARVTDYIAQRAQTELLLEATLGREAALREEFDAYKIKRTEFAHKVGELTEKIEQIIDALQQRLLTAGQRIGELESILGRLIKDCLASDFNEHWDSFISAESALKLAAEGEGS